MLRFFCEKSILFRDGVSTIRKLPRAGAKELKNDEIQVTLLLLCACYEILVRVEQLHYERFEELTRLE